MERWLAASIAALLGMAPWLSSRAEELVVYRCSDGDAAVSLQDTPCPPDQQQHARSITRPIDAPTATTVVIAPLPETVAAPAVRDVRVTVVNPQPLYDCQRHDGSTYESDSGVAERRWVPLWVMGRDPRVAGQALGGVGRPLPPPAPAGAPGTSAVVAYPAGAWVEDRCYRLSAAVACERRHARLRDLGQRWRNAFPSERGRIETERDGLREQLQQECGID